MGVIISYPIPKRKNTMSDIHHIEAKIVEIKNLAKYLVLEWEHYKRLASARQETINELRKDNEELNEKLKKLL